jgi:hypothetical protein
MANILQIEALVVLLDEVKRCWANKGVEDAPQSKQVPQSNWRDYPDRDHQCEEWHLVHLAGISSRAQRY